jgi:hypothetical protein
MVTLTAVSPVVFAGDESAGVPVKAAEVVKENADVHPVPPLLTRQ